MESLDSILSGFNPEGNPPQDPPPVEPEEGATPPEDSEGTPPDEGGSKEGDDNKQKPEDVFKSTKQNEAFARMRVENNQYRGVLTRLASLMGVTEVSDPNVLIEAITVRLREQEAKAHQVPAEFLARIEQAEQRAAQYEQDRLRDQALLGFQKLKDTYQLDDVSLQAFAKQLDEAGVNPFVEPIDLVQEYKLRNYDTLMADAIDKAVQAALAQKNHTSSHSTEPGRAKGKGDQQGKKIDTVQGLTDLMADLK